MPAPGISGLLPNYSMEIPPFLKRNEDGSFQYPNLSQFSFGRTHDHTGSYRAVTLAPEDRGPGYTATKHGYPLTEHDRKVMSELEGTQAAIERERRKESSAASYAKRKLDKERKQQIQQSQRLNFHQHFRWDWEK
jgi:hypothetical protein